MKIKTQRTLFLTIFSRFFMPGHNFILLALRGNLLDFRGIKRQFLQLTRDEFFFACSFYTPWPQLMLGIINVSFWFSRLHKMQVVLFILSFNSTSQKRKNWVKNKINGYKFDFCHNILVSCDKPNGSGYIKHAVSGRRVFTQFLYFTLYTLWQTSVIFLWPIKLQTDVY